MIRRHTTPLLAASLALVLLGVLAACTPDPELDPTGRCVGFQLKTAVRVHPSSTPTNPSWDITFTNTNASACVFGGVPTIRFLARGGNHTVGTAERADSDAIAVPLSKGDVAYAHLTLSTKVPAGCTPTTVGSLSIIAPHVAGGGYLVKAPAAVKGCAKSVVIAHVGRVTARRAP